MCGIENQIAEHRNEELEPCFYCEEAKDEEYTEVKTGTYGVQWVCRECVKEFDNE